jgi:uncharacterized protein YndB with AHSA1/START domain
VLTLGAVAEKRVELELSIDAPIADVWRGLTDVSAYHTWNPFVIEASSEGASTDVGAMLSLTVQWADGGGARSKEQVVVANAPNAGANEALQAEWVYSFRSWMSTIGMIRSVRTQRLEQAPGQPTIYTSAIHLTGWGAAGAPAHKIKAGMRAQGEALKRLLQSVPPGD